MSRKLNIALTGLNAIDSPGPGVAVARGLKEAQSFDARIIGLSYESLEPGLYLHDLFDKSYQIPYPTVGTKTLLERIKYIHSIEKLDVIIPNFDAELYSFMKLEQELLNMGIRMFLPTESQFDERQKINLDEFGKKHKIKVPKSKAIYDPGEVYQMHEEFSYPLLVKGQYYDAYVAYTPQQATTFFNKISAKWGVPIIIQEFVKGEEYNVTGLGDGKGNMTAAVPMRKQYITDKGKAWGGISIADENMLDLTRHFLSSTKWRGPFELELMKNSDEEFYLLEINPRMPAWIYLAVGVGQNIPEAIVNLALGEEVPEFKHYEKSKMFIRYSWDMVVDISEFQQISTYGEL
jgi:carbamoyl-phosphate synthase large subunit